MASKFEKINILQDVKNLEKHFETRPQFQLRLSRHLTSTFFTPGMNINFRKYTGGWVLKGFFIYYIYHYIFVRKPLVPYLNREGYYSYDHGHHTGEMGPRPL